MWHRGRVLQDSSQAVMKERMKNEGLQKIDLRYFRWTEKPFRVAITFSLESFRELSNN